MNEIIDEHNNCSLTKPEVKSRIDNPILETKKIRKDKNKAKVIISREKTEKEKEKNCLPLNAFLFYTFS